MSFHHPIVGPACAHVDGVSASATLHNVPSTRMNIPSADIHNNRRDNATKQRKRGPYSRLKCDDCRKDKKKCIIPDDRRLRQACDRCEQRNITCSLAQTSSGQQSGRPEIARHPSPAVNSTPVVENSLFHDCILLISLIRIFHTIRLVAMDIDSNIRNGPSAPYIDTMSLHHKIITTIFGDISTLRNLLEHKLLTLRKLDDVDERGTLLTALGSRLRALSYIPTCRGIGIDLLLSEQSVEDLNLRSDCYHATDVERCVELLYEPEWYLYRNNKYKNTVDSYSSRYISSLRSLWEKLHTIGLLHGGDFSIASPFVHDLWLRGEDAHYSLDFLKCLCRVDAESVGCPPALMNDCLGRTVLHFMIENQLKLSSSEVLHELDTRQAYYRHLVDVTDVFGRTPLHVACTTPSERFFQKRFIEILLKNGANIKIRDSYGLLAIEYAMLKEREDILELFHKIRGINIQEALTTIKKLGDNKRQVRIDIDAGRSQLWKRVS
ncbi:hypothetical protein F5Y14DRAFT_68475 [Nemania sp. NC0429]|nr:hypothetical protein F5Y14DRAFT_68475 [Nemania sp. NC0429]